MKRKRATLLLLCALSLPLPAATAEIDDMFGVMFRMMLVMMNVMSDSMLANDTLGFGNSNPFGFGNSSPFGFGSSNPFGLGMTAWPALSSIYGLSPMTGGGLLPASGFSPWGGSGPWGGSSPWGGSAPWGGNAPWGGGAPWGGATPWSGPGGFPGYGSGWSPWSTPYMGDSWPNPLAQGGYGPYSPADYGNWGGPGYTAPVSLLEGRWFGASGEVLEVRGDRFQLQHGQYGLSGVVRIENNIVNLFSPETGTISRYTFIRNQSNLLMQDPAGNVLSFTQRPGGVVHVF